MKQTVLMTCSLTAILVSRFLLDLQEANQTAARVDGVNANDSSRGSQWNASGDSTPSFISSLGAFINPDLSSGACTDDDSEEDSGSRRQGRSWCEDHRDNDADRVRSFHIAEEEQESI